MANPRKFSEKIALLNQKLAEETVAFEAIMREVSHVTSRTALSTLEEIQHNPMMYRSAERGRPMGVGPMRPRPMEKRHDTSPYSGAPYLSPPLPDTWRRTNSDSALHQSANEACQAANSMPHRRDQHALGGVANENRDGHHHNYIERPKSSCEMPRVPGIYIYPSTQSPEQQIPIGNNTGSLPDLSNVHFPAPLHSGLDHEDHSSSTQYSNNHLSVPVNSRFLHTCKGVALDNSSSTSQQELHSYTQHHQNQQQQQQQGQIQQQQQQQQQSQIQQQQQGQIQQQQPPTSHGSGHYIYQQPHSPVPQSPKASQSQQSHQQQQSQQQQQLNSLTSYRTSQQVHRPSSQSSPSLTVQGSPLSYSNNPSAPSSPNGHSTQANLSSDRIDQSSYFINQAQAAALQQTFEQFSMVDSTVDPNTINPYIGSPNHTTNYVANDMINVGGDLGSSDAGYFSTSPQLAYQPRTPTNAQQLTPQTPNTPTIILTDFSGSDDLTNSEFVKDFDFNPDIFTSDDVLRQGLGQIDIDGLQMLTDPDVVISDANAEDHFRLDRL